MIASHAGSADKKSLLDEFRELVNGCDSNDVQRVMKMTKRDVLQRFDAIEQKGEPMDSVFRQRLGRLFTEQEAREGKEHDLVAEESAEYRRQVEALERPTTEDEAIGDEMIAQHNRLHREILRDRGALEGQWNRFEKGADVQEEAASRGTDDARGIADARELLKEKRPGRQPPKKTTANDGFPESSKN